MGRDVEVDAKEEGWKWEGERAGRELARGRRGGSAVEVGDLERKELLCLCGDGARETAVGKEDVSGLNG